MVRSLFYPQQVLRNTRVNHEFRRAANVVAMNIWLRPIMFGGERSMSFLVRGSLMYPIAAGSDNGTRASPTLTVARHRWSRTRFLLASQNQVVKFPFVSNFSQNELSRGALAIKRQIDDRFVGRDHLLIKNMKPGSGRRQHIRHCFDLHFLLCLGQPVLLPLTFQLSDGLRRATLSP